MFTYILFLPLSFQSSSSSHPPNPSFILYLSGLIYTYLYLHPHHLFSHLLPTHPPQFSPRMFWGVVCICVGIIVYVGYLCLCMFDVRVRYYYILYYYILYIILLYSVIIYYILYSPPLPLISSSNPFFPLPFLLPSSFILYLSILIYTYLYSILLNKTHPAHFIGGMSRVV